MKFMLDTDACIRFMNRSHPTLTERVVANPAEALCISIITAAELTFGAERSAHRPKNRERLGEFRGTIRTVPFDEVAVETYGAVRAGLTPRGVVIGPLDLLIAAHALSLGLTLVTGNLKEFSRVKGLRLEDWRVAV